VNKMDRLIEQLKRHEGVETHAYKCSNGKLTIGVGRNIDPEGGIGLTMDEIEYLLSNDILRCIKELSTEYPWFGDLDEVRQEAIINIFLNLGATKFRLFKRALSAMEEGDYETASTEFLDSLWAKQVGGRALELTDIIRSGEYV